MPRTHTSAVNRSATEPSPSEGNAIAAGDEIVSVIGAVCGETPAPVAVTAMVVVPGTAAVVSVNCRLLLVVVPVSVGGSNVAVIPAGTPEAESAIVPANPPLRVTETDVVLLLPRMADSVAPTARLMAGVDGSIGLGSESVPHPIRNTAQASRRSDRAFMGNFSIKVVGPTRRIGPCVYASYQHVHVLPPSPTTGRMLHRSRVERKRPVSATPRAARE